MTMGTTTGAEMMELLGSRSKQHTLPQPLARRLVAAMNWQELLLWLTQGQRRTPEQAANLCAAVATLEALEECPAPPSRDGTL